MPNELYNEHSLNRSKDDSGVITTSGSFSFWEETPSSPLQIGDTFKPLGEGGPTLTVRNIDVSDNVIGKYNDRLKRVWKITVSGEDVGDELAHITYQLSINEENDGTITYSLTENVTNIGSVPIFKRNIGSTIPHSHLGDIGLNDDSKIRCNSISGGNSYANDKQRWDMTFSGTCIIIGKTYTSYQFSQEQQDDGSIVKSASKTVINIGSQPANATQLNGAVSKVDGYDSIKCKSISGSNSYVNGQERWEVTYSGTDTEEPKDPIKSYSYSEEKQDNGLILKSGSVSYIEVAEDKPDFPAEIGKTFEIPGCGKLTCTGVSANSSVSNGKRRWEVTSNGAAIDIEEKVDDKEQYIGTNYSINGTTARTIEGEFVVLRRSTTPIAQSSYMKYTEDEAHGLTVGNTHKGGNITSIRTTKEDIKINGVLIRRLYRHDIEVEQ